MPRREVMQHMLPANVALVTNRSQEIPGEWTNALVSDGLITHHTLSLKEVNYLFPLYLHSPDKAENLSPDFRAFVDSRYEHHYAPEEILGYIYAVLYAPAYRSRYAEFLRIDFPRIPFPKATTHFEILSGMGWDLMQKHLLRDVARAGLGKYQGKGHNEVEKPRYVDAEQSIWINETQKFVPVPQEVWDFHIGGYQVLSKFLKDRKGRTLTLDEINNVENVANVLAFTIDQMVKIDRAYLLAFPDRG